MRATRKRPALEPSMTKGMGKVQVGFPFGHVVMEVD